MALNGKERQKKYKTRLKELNKRSVTVDISNEAYTCLLSEKKQTGKNFSVIMDSAVANLIRPDFGNTITTGQKETAADESEEKFKTIFENANDVIIYVNMEGIIIDINKRLEEVFGYKRKEVIGKSIAEFKILCSRDVQSSIKSLENLASEIPPQMQLNVLSIQEFEAYHKDGTPIFIEVNPRLVQKNGKKIGVLTIIRDVTQRKHVEKELRELHGDLENKVKERTESLEDANTTLRVLLKKMDADKIELEEKILLNIRELIIPTIERLHHSRLNEIQKAHVDLLESDLRDIISPLTQKLTSRHLNLTHQEMQVANLIKHGKTTKEIANTLNLSSRTIDFHRSKIRKKIGINNKKISLRSSLLSFQ
jgi:PAS domain S-box-containing protein